MSEQMKPCPFCGSEAVAESYAIEAAVRCLSCRAKIVRPHGAHTDNGYPDAIAAWNRRSPDWIEEAAKALESLSADTIRLHMGELSAQEMRSVNAFRNWQAAAIRALQEK